MAKKFVKLKKRDVSGPMGVKGIVSIVWDRKVLFPMRNIVSFLM